MNIVYNLHFIAYKKQRSDCMTERETTTQAMADEKSFTFYSSEFKWISKIKKLAEQYPQEVIIKDIYFEDGKECSITAEIPKRYFKISHPRTVSEEQRQAAAERLRRYREGQ